MKRNTNILNADIAKLITGLRHGDMIMITDAGCPVPFNIPCIDLGITYGIPTIEQILNIIDTEMVSEKIVYAKELQANNPSFYKKVQAIFTDVDHEEIMHQELVNTRMNTLKAVIRTGEFSPWGNIIIVSGTDPFLWFADKTTIVPEFYHKRLKQIRNSGKLELFDQSHFDREDC